MTSAVTDRSVVSAYERLMAAVSPLTVAAEAAAAVAATLTLDAAGIRADETIRAQLDRVVSLVAGPEVLAGVAEAQRRTVMGTITSFLKQAHDLIEHPERPGGWAYTDPIVLDAQGQSSAFVPPLIARVAPNLDGLVEALQRENARILDVGAGIAALSIACCRVFPNASVVGLEPWGPAIELGLANVDAAGLAHRITLRAERVEDIQDRSTYHLAWMPAPFLSRSVLDSAASRVADALDRGGWLVLGRYAAPSDPLAEAVAELRTVRGGGTPLTDDEAIDVLERAGLEKVHAVKSDWTAPIRFVAGRRK